MMDLQTEIKVKAYDDRHMMDLLRVLTAYSGPTDREHALQSVDCIQWTYRQGACTAEC